MTSPIDQAAELKAQADDVLRAAGLVELLEGHGAVNVLLGSPELVATRDIIGLREPSFE